jgi:lipopolysaccharide/colanic/teichoic acid biosynthesis glycosyltransferase
VNVKADLSKTTSVPANCITIHKVKEHLLKRPLDVILSTFMLILSLPVSLPIVVAIKLEDNGPIFYRQERWGGATQRARSRGIAQSVDKQRAGSWHRVS